MLRKYKYPFLIFLTPVTMACTADNDENKTIASTHPALEEQLKEDSITSPVINGDSSNLYQRYRITMDEYETNNTYAVQEVYRGNMPLLDERSHPEARNFRTVIQEGLKKGVNFAGKFTVVNVGCGTSCQQHFIVNRESGKVVDKIQSSLGAKYSANSSLFILNPPDSTVDYSTCDGCTPEAYVLENNKLRKASSVNEILN